MSKALYQIEQKAENLFQLYESGILLCTFSRSNLREVLGTLGRGENWIGSIVRLLNQKYPFHLPAAGREKSDVLRGMGLDAIVKHLKSKGFRVYKKQKVSDIDMIKHLESLGYYVEGLVGDSFYSTEENEKVSRVGL